MINSKLLPPVCFSWNCEIPRRTRPPQKLVAEFVTEFCDRTPTSDWSPGLWPISLSSQVPPSWTPPPPRSACFIAIIIIVAIVIFLSRFTAYLSETHHFFPTVVSQLWASSGCCERQKFHYRTPLLPPWYCVQIYFVKLTQIEEFGGEILIHHEILRILFTSENILRISDISSVWNRGLFSSFPISSF